MFLGLDPVTWAVVAVGLVIATASFVRRRRQGVPKWDPRPPTARERIFAGIGAAAFLVVSANLVAGWRLFDGYDDWVFIAVFIASLFLIQQLPGVTHS